MTQPQIKYYIQLHKIQNQISQINNSNLIFLIPKTGEQNELEQRTLLYCKQWNYAIRKYFHKEGEEGIKLQV